MQTRNLDDLDVSPEGYRDRLDQLLAHLEALSVSQPSLRGRPGVTAERALTVWGLAARAHALARIVSEVGAGGMAGAVDADGIRCALDAQRIITRGPEALPGSGRSCGRGERWTG